MDSFWKSIGIDLDNIDKENPLDMTDEQRLNLLREELNTLECYSSSVVRGYESLIQQVELEKQNIKRIQRLIGLKKKQINLLRIKMNNHE